MFNRQKIPRYLILEEPKPVVSRWWRWFRITCLLLMSALSVLVFIAATSAAAAAQQAENPVNAAQSGELLMREEGSGQHHRALQLQSNVDIQVSGLVAQVLVEQTFKNNSDRWVEGVYVFPLPDSAAVNHMQMVIGERVIVGEIKEKQEARKIYQQARAQGKKASLVEQQRPNIFTNRVANIGPGETVVISLRYVQQVSYQDAQFSLRFPMTITPRYIPGQALIEQEQAELSVDPSLGWAVDTDQVPDASQITPLQDPHRAPNVTVNARIDMGLPLAQVESLFHDMQLSRSGHQYELQLTQSQVPMNSDLVLQWRAQPGKEPRAAFFQETVDEQRYGLLMVIPPESTAAVGVSRELIFVIDTSGSMGGISIVQARASLQFALSQLSAQDRFNIVEFNSSARALFPTALAATSHNLARASEFVRHLDAGGGTEMMQALQMALSSDGDEERDSEMLRQVVFITDGAVGNELALFQEIQNSLGRSRLFTVGIGSAPNSWFMRKAAEVGAGQFVFVGEVSQVQNNMQILFDKISRPLAVDLDVHWPQGAEVYPARIPDLYSGQPVLVSVQLPEFESDRPIRVAGKVSGKEWRRDLKLPAPSATPAEHSGVSTLWARQKIEMLLDQKILGKQEAEVRAAVLPVALTHQLVSPYTSFVAVEQTVSRASQEGLLSKAVLNGKPKGQAPQPYAYPKTATGWAFQLLYSLILVIPWLLTRFRKPRWL
jgi:Ca-activated chloride channel homolog